MVFIFHIQIQDLKVVLPVEAFVFRCLSDPDGFLSLSGSSV